MQMIRIRSALGRAARFATLAVCVLGAVTACGLRDPAGIGASPAAAAAIPAGQSTQTVDVHGAVRTYHLYRPAGLLARSPLVVMLHGGFGSGLQAERCYGWDQEADRAHFLVAYPDGLNQAWNAGGGCCGQPAANGVNDVAFITAMVTGHRPPASARSAPAVRHGHLQRRHHGLPARLRHPCVRRDRAGLGHAARAVR